MIRLRFFRPAIAVLALAVLAAGCGRARTVPTASAPDPAADATSTFPPQSHPAVPELAGFYPLATGNRWHYQHRFKVEVIGAQPGAYEYLSEVEHLQTCPVTIGTRDYLTERVAQFGEGGVSAYWLRLRQDRRGLFEAEETGVDPSCEVFEASANAARLDPAAELDAAWARASSGIVDPERRAAFDRAWQDARAHLALIQSSLAPRAGAFGPTFGLPGPPGGEVLRLAYPLQPGQRWTIRSGPGFNAGVEALETLDLPAGWFAAYRIRYSSEFFGPLDRVYVWYGPKGYLKLDARTESAVRDAEGNRIGTVWTETIEVLDEIALVDPPTGRAVAEP